MEQCVSCAVPAPADAGQRRIAEQLSDVRHVNDVQACSPPRRGVSAAGETFVWTTVFFWMERREYLEQHEPRGIKKQGRGGGGEGPQRWSLAGLRWHDRGDPSVGKAESSPNGVGVAWRE